MNLDELRTREGGSGMSAAATYQQTRYRLPALPFLTLFLLFPVQLLDTQPPSPQGTSTGGWLPPEQALELTACRPASRSVSIQRAQRVSHVISDTLVCDQTLVNKRFPANRSSN